MKALHALAQAAGVAVRWRDGNGRPQTTPPDTLRAVLTALGHACQTPGQTADSLAALQAEDLNQSLPPLLPARVGSRVELRVPASWGGQRFCIELENGTRQEGVIQLSAEHVWSLAVPVEPGYHRLETPGSASPSESCVLAACPSRCYSVADAVHGRAWGLAAQTYSLRREEGGGLGDFGAVRLLAEQAAGHGAHALLLSPAHAGFAAVPEQFSPYSPSSRLVWNPLYADIDDVLGAGALNTALNDLGLSSDWHAQEQASWVDWPAISRLRQAVLRHVFEGWRAGASNERKADLKAFTDQEGPVLEQHARFEALHAWNLTQGRAGWRAWPEALQQPEHAQVRAFAQAHVQEVDFHRFCQWLTVRSLEKAHSTGRSAGMGVGLIADLAVGVDSGGSEAWSRQREMLIGLSIGAPPDLINDQGQNWGLTSYAPRGLRAQGYGAFLALLRAGMRRTGGLRIDHVLGLNRLWVIPEGAAPTEGAYLNNRLDELLALTALESWRHRAIVIGEDLGTVPPGLRNTLSETGVLGMRVLWFERQGKTKPAHFVPPQRYAKNAVATTTTHDLPTVAGWWSERDLQWRKQVGWIDDERFAEESQARAEDRQALWKALTEAGSAVGPAPAVDQADKVVLPAVDFISRSASPLALLPVEDVLGLDEQPNLPGTIDQHPNWRRRLPVSTQTLFEDPEVRARLARIRDHRS